MLDMDRIQAFLYMIGSITCHQIPERTLFVDGMPLPFCARDTGIYTGIFLSFVYLSLKRRMKSDRPPGIKVALVLCALMLPMFADGISSYLGMRTTDNWIRLVTGALFGMAVPVLLVPAAKFRVFGENRLYSLKDIKEVLGLLALVCAACAVILENVFIPWIVLALVTVLSFFMAVAALAGVILSRLGISGRVKLLFLDAFVTCAVVALMYIGSVYVIQPLEQIFL